MLTRLPLAGAALLALSACLADRSGTTIPDRGVEVQILAINDFHGNLEPPKLSIDAAAADGAVVQVPAGGVTYLASAARSLRAGNQYSVTVSAGDLIGASPLISGMYLDEPTIAAMNLVGLELNAVGNHEFDKGTAELLRMQQGGCEKFTARRPCAVEQFAGAKFRFLSANVLTSDGGTLFPGFAIKKFGTVRIAFIGMTLKETGEIVRPGGLEGVTFADEAATANALVPTLKTAGADAIVLLIHQGGRLTGGYGDKSCRSLAGAIVPILERLHPSIDVVISGHTHAAYTCELPRDRLHPLLLTSAGQYGTLITDIRLVFSPDRRLVGQRADNVIVQGEPYSTASGEVPLVASQRVYEPDAAVAALLNRYAAAANADSRRVVGKLSEPVTLARSADGEHSAGNFVADALLNAGKAAGAEIAFVNSSGVRSDLVPAADGSVSYGAIFAMQPFGNRVSTVTLTGAQLKALLEQQFASGRNTAEQPAMLLPSRGFHFSFDLQRPAGDRIVEMRLDGKLIEPLARYRIAAPDFLVAGGGNFTVFTQGTEIADAGEDLDAVQQWLALGATAPQLGRIRKVQ